MVDTGKRIIEAATVLKENGVKQVFVCATHPIFSGDVMNIQNSPV